MWRMRAARSESTRRCAIASHSGQRTPPWFSRNTATLNLKPARREADVQVSKWYKRRQDSVLGMALPRLDLRLPASEIRICGQQMSEARMLRTDSSARL